MELLCPTGNLPALKSAVNNSTAAIYIGLYCQNFADKLSSLGGFGTI